MNIYKENIIGKLDKALAQIHILERVDDGHVRADRNQVSDVIKRIRNLVEESKRLTELSK